MRRLNYRARFISQMTAKCDPIFKMLRKHNFDKWDEKCQIAFDKVKEYLTNALVLGPPIPKRPLILFLMVYERSIGCVLGNMMKPNAKSRPYTILARNSQTMNQSIHPKKRCVVHQHGQLKGLDNTCFTTLLGSLQDWIPLSIFFRSPHYLEGSQGGKCYCQSSTSCMCLRRPSKEMQQPTFQWRELMKNTSP